MVKEHYRWDFIGLSTDEKPTPETSEKVVDGSTFYCSDTSKLYVFCQDEWYEKKPLGEGGGGGSSITPVQTTGTSTTDVMSQDATTKMIYPDITNNPTKISIGNSTINANTGVAINGTINTTRTNNIVISANPSSPAVVGPNGRSDNIVIGSDAHNDMGTGNISIGTSANSTGGGTTPYNVAIGFYADVNSKNYSVALGGEARCTRDGEVNIGTGYNSHGFNSTQYRVIGGVHDGQLANDAVTVGQINALIDAINTATGSSISHIGA